MFLKNCHKAYPTCDIPPCVYNRCYVYSNTAAVTHKAFVMTCQVDCCHYVKCFGRLSTNSGKIVLSLNGSNLLGICRYFWVSGKDVWDLVLVDSHSIFSSIFAKLQFRHCLFNASRTQRGFSGL